MITSVVLVKKSNIFLPRKKTKLTLIDILDKADELALNNPKVCKQINLDLDKHSIVFNTCLYLKKAGWSNHMLEEIKELALSGDIGQAKYVCKKVLGYYN